MGRPKLDGTPAKKPIQRKLDALFVQKVEPKSTPFHVWDTHQRGLTLRVQPSGQRSYYVYHRRLGKSGWRCIGDAGEISLETARQIANGVRAGWQFQRRRSIAKKFLDFLDQNIEPQCYLYRHYDPNGDLLYVGVSLDGLRRQMQHSKGSEWRVAIYQIIIEPFATREEALEAEQQAIRTEYPKYNLIYNNRSNPLREVARLAP